MGHCPGIRSRRCPDRRQTICGAIKVVARNASKPIKNATIVDAITV